jgi:integrase
MTQDQERLLRWVVADELGRGRVREQREPLEDRDTKSRLFPDSNSAAFRRALARGCKAVGVPLFSPHDLRHRRISLPTTAT